jgi:site-specific DNA-methyltransferase (adenine-specific)
LGGGGYDKEETANNVISYIQTRFFRFLVGLLKNTQNAYRQVYSFVPIQDFTESWTDEKLYKKYKLTKAEVEFIESMIRPMDNGEEADE